MKIKLRLPFKGNFPISFPFGAVPSNELLRQKYHAWGISGHNGIDFAAPMGTKVYAVASGKVIQVGINGEFGISITLKHRWGISLYAHLSSTGVVVGQQIRSGRLIGLSGNSGLVFGEHLHFALMLSNPNKANGYLGYIDPTTYFEK